jgi:hypothetical protein
VTVVVESSEPPQPATPKATTASAAREIALKRLPVNLKALPPLRSPTGRRRI